MAAKLDLQAEIAALKPEISGATVRTAPGFPSAFYFDLGEDGAQLHVVDGASSHLMVSILGFGDGSRASRAAAQIARKAMRKL